tara:strand:+ start:797 stop:1018 length:222 start_codon:yes stop_codon:yes gene_type:complete
MWNELLLSLGGTATLFISSYQLGRFCARRELNNSLSELEKSSKKLNKDKDEIQTCINEHHKLLNELEDMWKWK